MHKLIATTSFAALLGLSGLAIAQTSTTPPAAGGSAAMQMSAAECTALWGQLDADKDGSATTSENKNLVSTAEWAAADTNKDGKLSKAEFDAACAAGKIH